MPQHEPDEINRLIVEFIDLQESWERAPSSFDWSRLQALARKGARAYNEEAGPSFHALALDAVTHSEFHERFLGYLLEADFDPFKLARPGNSVAAIPVIDHADLAEASRSNPSSARMRAALMEVARPRFVSLAQRIRGGQDLSPEMLVVVESCAESIPLDLLAQIAPELAKEHHGDPQRQPINPTEGYLSSAEFIVEIGTKPYG